jgi:3'-5' exoribonuclease
MRRFVDQLRDGDPIDDVYLAADKQLRVNRKGNQFVQLMLRDRSGGISARMWNAGDAIFRSFENGDLVRADGKVQLFEGALQVILNHVERAEADKEQIDLGDFLPRTEQDVVKLADRLRGYLTGLANPHLKALADEFLKDAAFARQFMACPAGVKLHHAFVGGLLEHTVTMMDIADRLLPFYPGVDRDLLLMGVFLHDAGKTRELTYARAFGYSDEGQLVGHIAIAVEMLTEKAAKLAEPVPRETLVRLKHMVLSHHGTHEFGSPKVPMTPEAMLLHEIDSLDTRMHMALREIKDDRAGPTAWTQYNPTLGRRFYKGGGTGEFFSAAAEAFD